MADDNDRTRGATMNATMNATMGETRAANAAPGDAVLLCPLTRSKCMGEWCAWHIAHASGVKGCVATHVADALLEVSYQMTLG